MKQGKKKADHQYGLGTLPQSHLSTFFILALEVIRGH